jgi:hypothetical protein
MQEASVHASAVNQAKGHHIPWGWVAITAVGLEVAVTLAALIWVGIYSYLIHPGQQLPHYENYARFASPIVSVVVGIPVWFFACRWVGRKAGTCAVTMCLSAWLIVPVIDIPLSLPGQAKAYDWAMVAISDSTKLIAAYLGGKAALKYVPRTRRFS